MLFVKVDRPDGRGPDAHQDRSLCLLEHMVEQDAAQSLVPVRRRDVGVADQSHVLHWLYAHDADQDAIDLHTGESNTFGDFVLQLFQRYVRFLPAVGGNCAPVSLGSVIDDLEHPLQIVRPAGADHLICDPGLKLDHIALRIGHVAPRDLGPCRCC